MPWTNDDIHCAARYQRDIADDLRMRVNGYDVDFQHDARLAKNLCRSCCYLRGPIIAGQAFTEYKCRNCHENFRHPNTAVPQLCEWCAKMLNACCRCGGPVDSYSPPLQVKR